MEAISTSDFSNHQITDSAVIKRVLAGEKVLYEILLRRNNQQLYRVVRSYLKDHAEVEDVMQNTYLKAFEKLYQFKHTSAFSTWLIRIGINESLARIKEKGRVLDLKDPSGNKENHVVLEMPDNHQLNPEKKMIRREAKELLESTIDSLPTKYKTVYILKEVEEMNVKDISECLEISPANVKVRFHRAKGMLKEKLYESAVNKDIFEFGFSKCDRITEQVMRMILLGA